MDEQCSGDVPASCVEASDQLQDSEPQTPSHESDSSLTHSDQDVRSADTTPPTVIGTEAHLLPPNTTAVPHAQKRKRRQNAQRANSQKPPEKPPTKDQQIYIPYAITDSEAARLRGMYNAWRTHRIYGQVTVGINTYLWWRCTQPITSVMAPPDPTMCINAPGSKGAILQSPAPTKECYRELIVMGTADYPVPAPPPGCDGTRRYTLNLKNTNVPPMHHPCRCGSDPITCSACEHAAIRSCDLAWMQILLQDNPVDNGLLVWRLYLASSINPQTTLHELVIADTADDPITVMETYESALQTEDTAANTQATVVVENLHQQSFLVSSATATARSKRHYTAV